MQASAGKRERMTGRFPAELHVSAQRRCFDALDAERSKALLITACPDAAVNATERAKEPPLALASRGQ